MIDYFKEQETSQLPPFTTWNGAFTPAELADITGLGYAHIPRAARVEDGQTPATSVRRCSTSWLPLGGEIRPICVRLLAIARNLNDEHYQFDLDGLAEKLQFTVYEGADDGHYDWHIDHLPGAPRPRKLALVLQLSDPADYEGGQLQVRAGNEIDDVPKGRGLVACFPAFVLHRVTPVTRGTRRTLVAWIAGPAFR